MISSVGGVVGSWRIIVLGLFALGAVVWAAQPVAASSPPATPDSVTVTRADGTLTASWVGVFGATSYHITYSSDAGASWSLAAFSYSPTTITISNISNSSTYIVGVRAYNPSGWSGWRNSPSSPPYSTLPPQPPPTSPPASVDGIATTRADGTLTATWTSVPTATHYHITYSSNGGGSWSLAAYAHPAGSPTTGITFGVHNSNTYVVGVRAWNAAGWSGWTNSAPSNPYYVNPPAFPPPAISSITTSRSAGSLTATWDAVGTASKYHVNYSSNGGASWTAVTMNHPAASPKTSIVISVDQAKTYIVAARAGNHSGWSGWTNSSPAEPVGLDAPATVTLAHNGTTLAASWDAVDDAFCYDVEMRDGQGGSWLPVLVGATGTSATITAPNHRSSYQIRVQALTEENAGSPWTESSMAHPSMQPPATPYWLNLSRTGHDTVKATWNAVSNQTGYTVQYSGDNWATQSSTTLAAADSSAFFNMDLTKTWVARVKATNVYGDSQWRYSTAMGPPQLTAEGFWDYGEIKLTNFGGNWYYKANVGPHATCQGPVSGGSLTVSGLANATEYTYSVHDNETCDAVTDDDEETFDTTPVSVSNLAETTAGTVGIVGRYSNTVYRHASAFSTGSNSGGYDLSSVTLGVWQIQGSPTALNLTIHADSGGNPAGSATHTLTGTSPTAGGDHTYTCPGTCKLEPNTVYHLVIAASLPASGNHYYGIDRTTSDNQTNTPSTAGWSIGNVYKYNWPGFNFWNTNTDSYIHQFTVNATPIDPDARTVDNLGETKVGTSAVGMIDGTAYSRASAFTTGSVSDGYKLQGVTISVETTTGSPTGFTAAIHRASGSSPASAALYTLTGTTPAAGGGDYTFSCSGTCSLSANTTYYLVMSGTGPSTGHHYYAIDETTSDTETNTPSSAGWSIANVSKTSYGGGGWSDNGQSRIHQFSVTAKEVSIPTAVAGPVGFSTLTPLNLLTATNVADTSLTLNIYSGYTKLGWYYSRIGGGPTDQCVAVSGHSVNLTGLTATTRYEYIAYYGPWCLSSQIIGRTWVTTADAGVGNLTHNLDGGCVIGKPSGSTHRQCAAAFTTGANPNGGYFLHSAAVQLGIDSGGTVSTKVALHAADGNGAPETQPMAMLGSTGSKARGAYTFTCLNKGTCNLEEKTTYFIVVSAPYSAYNFWRHWETRNSGQEYRWPADLNWAITGGAMYKLGNGDWTEDPSGKTPVFHVAVSETGGGTLTAQTIEATEASLRISGHTGAWYFNSNKSPYNSTCTAISSGTRVDVTGLSGETHYVFTAYSDSSCTTPIASTQFTTLRAASLTATVNSDDTVYLTLSDGPDDWWFRIGHGCHAVSGNRYPTTGGIGGYTGTHTVTAYSDNTCTTQIASTTFTV